MLITKPDSGKIDIAFSHIPSKGWSAGEYYLKNIFIALKSLIEPERPKISLLVQDSDYQSLQPYVDNILVRPTFDPGSFFTRQIFTIARILNIKINRKNQISSFLQNSGIDVIFTIGELGDNFSLPLLSWIPDFQHLHFPNFFSDEEIARRDNAFTRSARNAKRVIVSSQCSYEDMRSFAPWALGKVRVLPFVAQIPKEIFDSDVNNICTKYNLPEKFVFIPNQFWKHKNHEMVIKALKKALPLCPSLRIVCTGNTIDQRDISYFGKLLGIISNAGVREQMILLGLVPREDMFSLMRQSLAVLQPSLFEGWSTTVEEVKSLGKPLIVSDIPVHREQDAPCAYYFDPMDYHNLAECLVTNFANLHPGPNTHMEKIARNALANRTNEFGSKFLEIVKELF